MRDYLDENIIWHRDIRTMIWHCVWEFRGYLMINEEIYFR